MPALIQDASVPFLILLAALPAHLIAAAWIVLYALNHAPRWKERGIMATVIILILTHACALLLLTAPPPSTTVEVRP